MKVCLDINECLSADSASLDKECTCDRCACQNVFGGYKCASPLVGHPPLTPFAELAFS